MPHHLDLGDPVIPRPSQIKPDHPRLAIPRPARRPMRNRPHPERALLVVHMPTRRRRNRTPSRCPLRALTARQPRPITHLPRDRLDLRRHRNPTRSNRRRPPRRPARRLHPQPHRQPHQSHRVRRLRQRRDPRSNRVQPHPSQQTPRQNSWINRTRVARSIHAHPILRVTTRRLPTRHQHPLTSPSRLALRLRHRTRSRRTRRQPRLRTPIPRIRRVPRGLALNPTFSRAHIRVAVGVRVRGRRGPNQSTRDHAHHHQAEPQLPHDFTLPCTS